MNKKKRKVTLTPKHTAVFETSDPRKCFTIEPQPDGTLRINSMYCGTHVEAERKAGYGIILKINERKELEK